MPGFNQRGPQGSGPMTGRGQGVCRNRNMAGDDYANRYGGRGCGRGFGGRGRGMGRGMGRGFGPAPVSVLRTTNQTTSQDK
ncbi:MAG: hypothetical protein CSA25_04480 [Desulfobacter postgatei]|uniref:Uncharacterized protein n=1 Tax=Desulfobacter postgatei TaxID=2293 RepID=A0A2G6MSH1_9BACT|nr:MAG: hypothetical protein CSA25_04480 [Desulfobacter postgatei]